ncbi:MAG TPA: hypothetical protein VHM70_15500 [Polyangiaceae bacterium]|nr:hypothetical protein [Polyangiaceae bacterium]
MGVIRNAAVHSIQQALEQAERHHAFVVLRQLDPIVRWRARRLVLQALRFADLSTGVESEPHRMRVAGLRILRRIPEAGYEDESAVRREFEQQVRATRAPTKGPWLLTALGASAALACIGWYLAARAFAPFDPRSSGLGHLLGPELTEYVVQASRANPSTRAQLNQEFTHEIDRVLTGDANVALKRTLLGVNRVFDSNGTEGAADDGRFDEFISGAVALDAALAKSEAPFFVDVDWSRRGSLVVPYLFSFYVERERSSNAVGHSVRSVHLWRLDNLAVQQAYLGYTRPHSPAALVLLDQIEADLIGDVLPALPDGETMDLVEFATRRTHKPWILAAESATAVAIRRHFAAFPPERAARHQSVGKLLAERRGLIRKWQDTLSELGAQLVVPIRLIPEADYLGELELRVPREQLRQWQSIHERLLEREAQGAFVELRDNFVAAVERHEIQHRIDYARELFEVPKVLVRRLNLDNALAAEAGSLAGRARDEFSAYLATVATTQPTPLLELALLARFLFDHARFAGAYTYAALAVYETIAEQLGLVPAVRERAVLERPDIAELVIAVLEQEPELLRSAAQAAYVAQFGDSVVDVKPETERANAPWRH